MTGSDPSLSAIGRSRIRLSRAALAHPLRALALTTAIAIPPAAGAAVAITALATRATPRPAAVGEGVARSLVARGAPSPSGLGAVLGRVLQGRAPDYEGLLTAEAQADAAPAAAVVDRGANTLRFTGGAAELTIVASPPNGTDMAFRVAGMENPTIEVTRGAQVTVHFVNGDNDSAHGWLLLDPVVTVGKQPHGPRAFAGSFAPILGDPTSAGQADETVTFTATAAGTYRYECPLPGHAAMGMQGGFVVLA